MKLPKKLWLNTIAVISICVVAFFLRIYKVDTIPPSLSWDEVSIGYNAYSILKTGKDEHGKFLPLDTFVAYGDYKPPLSIYLTVPSIALFGLTELGVRLPSALFGVFTVFITYFLIKQLFESHKKSEAIALIGSLVLAISPWHIQLSRAGYEANIATFLTTFGAWLVLSCRRQPQRLWFGFTPYILSMYTFNSARYFAPLICFGLLIFCWQDFRKNLKRLIFGVIIAIVLLIPLIPHMISPQARLRFTEVNIFNDASIVYTANKRISYSGNTAFAKIINNRRIGYLRSYLVHFFDHFQPWFLFIRGDGNPKFSLQDTGQLYILEMPFLLLGLYFISGYKKSIFFLLAYWLVGAMIPAATARETPHALRIENSLPVWQIFISFGLVTFVNLLKTNIKRAATIVIIGFYFFSLSYFWHNYFGHYAREYSGEWQYGYKQSMNITLPIKEKYRNIVISENIGRPYMYVLFYEKFDPEEYQRTKISGFDNYGFYKVWSFDKYFFVKEIYNFEKNNLYILPPNQVPPSAHVLKTIQLLNGDINLVVFDI